MQDGDYTLANSTAICLYMEKKQPAPAVLPGDAQAYGRALWFDAYAGGTIFATWCIRCFTRPSSRRTSARCRQTRL